MSSLIHMNVISYYVEKNEKDLATARPDYVMKDFCLTNKAYGGKGYIAGRSENKSFRWDVRLLNNINTVTCMDCLAIKIPGQLVGFKTWPK